MDSITLLEQWLFWLTQFWTDAAQLLLHLLFNTPIISIPIITLSTIVITIAWANKLPTLPIHISGWRLLLGKPAVSRWQSELIAKNIDHTLGKILIHPGELLEEIGQESMAKQAHHSLSPHLEEYVDDVMSADFSLVWENLPPLLKRRAYRRAEEGLPTFLDNLIEDLFRQSDTLINYKQLTQTLLHEYPLASERFFKSERIYDHTQVIQRSIGVGLCLSLPIMMLWFFGAPLWALLPLQFLTLCLSVYIVLRSIYSPLSQDTLGKIVIRNTLSLNRQQVIDQHAELIAVHILKLNQIIRHLFNGPNIPLTQKLIRKHLHTLIETFFTKMVIQIFFGLSGFLRLKRQAAEKVALLADYPFEDRQFQADRATAQKALISERLHGLPERDISAMIMPFATYLRTKTLLCSCITGIIMTAIQWYILV